MEINSNRCEYFKPKPYDQPKCKVTDERITLDHSCVYCTTSNHVNCNIRMLNTNPEKNESKSLEDKVIK